MSRKYQDNRSESVDLALQALGRHGYIRENARVQYLRDVRITRIVEGTNGIQVLDLVGGKLPVHLGRYLRGCFRPVSAYMDRHGASRERFDCATRFAQSRLRQRRGRRLPEVILVSGPGLPSGANGRDSVSSFGAWRQTRCDDRPAVLTVES